VKERVMAARRGVFRSGVHGVVGNELDMADPRHAVEWDVLVGAVAHATVVLYGQGCAGGYIRRSLCPTGSARARIRRKECE
jgi:hypothetical protein